MNNNDKPMQEGPECENGGSHDFGGEPVCLLCGISYAELYCNSYEVLGETE